MQTPRRVFCLSRTVAAALALLLLGTVLVMGGGIGFLNAPALLFTGGLTFCLLLGTFGRDYLTFIPDSILTLFSTPAEPVPRYADIARHGSRYAMAGAVIGSLIGFMQLLRHLDCPSSIGVGLALTFLPILYGLLLSEVVFAWLYKAYADGTELACAPPLGSRTLVLAAVVVGILIAVFLVMLLAFAHLDAYPRYG